MGEVAAPTRNLISVEEAQRLVLERVEPLPAETVSLSDARGRGSGSFERAKHWGLDGGPG